MKNITLATLLLTVICWAQAPSVLAGDETEQLKGIVQNLLQDNNDFVNSHSSDYFKPFDKGQHPRATVVTCSDSRVHMHAFDNTPDGDLFVVRNIGNQLRTSEGSVEYGVQHLHTPLLIFIGHSACGAIKAASGNYSRESRQIKHELSTIMIPKGIDNLEGVKKNVNNQVAAAIKKFRHEVQNRKLTVVGAVYDFQNDLGQGQGRLVIINYNGVTGADAARELTSMAAPTNQMGAVVATTTTNAAPATTINARPTSRMRPHPYAYP